jgi:hypothetical protein
MELRSGAITPQETVNDILKLIALREAAEASQARQPGPQREIAKHAHASRLLKEIMGDIQRIQFTAEKQKG